MAAVPAHEMKKGEIDVNAAGPAAAVAAVPAKKIKK